MLKQKIEGGVYTNRTADAAIEILQHFYFSSLVQQFLSFIKELLVKTRTQHDKKKRGENWVRLVINQMVKTSVSGSEPES